MKIIKIYQSYHKLYNIDRISHELKKEARQRILEHVNIVALFAIIFELGHFGFMMEYVLNGTLVDFVFNYDV